jgi:cell division transport system permease protein
MAVSTGYVVRETAVNLRRNLVMTAAAILTMFVSLTLLASAQLMRQATNKAAVQWKGGVELSIFLQANATDNERLAVGHQLSTMQGVKSVRFVDKPHAYEEFKAMFANTPDLVNSVSAPDMPPSFRVVPVRAEDVQAIGDHFKSAPGVRDVVYAKEIISSLLKDFHTKHNVAVVLSAVVFLGAIALIVNTIQLAIFARRREIAVMKLVGATNWFIRIPFMIEGLIDGIVGAVLAFVVTYVFRQTIASFVSSSPLIGGGGNVGGLYVTGTEAFYTGILILAVGALVGALGSAFAVRRFLAV